MASDKLNEKAIFNVARQIDSPEARLQYLHQICGADGELRKRIETLILVYEGSASFLESPPVGGASAAIDQLVTEKTGTVIGRYKLIEEIGEGGMGVVYVAEQTEPVRRKVALKIIKPGMDSKQVIARFEAERQALALMDHPHIAHVHDGGSTESGRPYFVMELVRGIPINEFCDDHQFTTRQRLQLFVDVCHAIQHAHQKGIIHRDIKPSNVLVTLHDVKPVVKVIDFGVAKAINQELAQQTVYTRFAQMIGTPLYMSPEQAEMNALDVDTRSDVYSLGVVLYELLTGETPFDRDIVDRVGFDEMRRMIREVDPLRPSHRISTLDVAAMSTACQRRRVDSRQLSRILFGELDWIVMKALEKDRNRRYETANSFANDIQHYLKDESVEACPPSAVYRLSKFARRNKAALSIVGMILSFLVLLGCLIGWTIRDREAREQGIVRDKTARQARVSQQVERILDEAVRFEQQQLWSEALLAAQRAEAVLAIGEVPEDLPARVKQVVSDLELVARLENIRLLPSKTTVGGFGYGDANQSYSAALREFGLDLDTLPPDEAVRRLQSRRRVLPALIVALDDWAACRLAAEDETGAKAVGELAQTLDTDPWRRRLRDARTDGSGKALEELVRSEELAGQPPSTIELLAGELEYQGRRAEAVEVLVRMLQVHPDDFWLHMKAAAAHSASRPRRIHEAIRHYTAALALRPRSAAVYYNLGIVLKDQGRLDEAEACYRRAIELAPKFAQAHTNLGAVLKAQGQLNEAIVCFRRAIELDPKLAPAHGNLGKALNDQGQLDEAIDCYRQAIEIDPNSATNHINLGVTLATQGKLDEAIPCFRQAVEADPQRALAHYNLGFALQMQEILGEAIACYRKAIEINPKLARVHNNLALVLGTANEIELRNPSEALDHGRTAVELDPKNWGFWDTLSIVAYRAGDWKTSLSARQEKISLHPIAAADRLFLAMTHWQLGNKAEARKSYEEAIRVIGNEQTESIDTRSLRQETEQLLEVTTSASPPEVGDPTGEEPQRRQ